MSEEIDYGDGLKVKLMTAWQFLRWDLWEDYYVNALPPELVAKVEGHRGHYVMVLDSAFGWREIRCQDEVRGCDVKLWDVHEEVERVG